MMSKRKRPSSNRLPVSRRVLASGGGAIAQTLPQVIQQAVAAYSSRDWDEAERLCRLVLVAKADCFDALNLLGAIAAQTQRAQEAAALFGRAVAANPSDASVHNNLGNALEGLRRLDEALGSYERALKLKPDYAEAYNNRGATLQALNRLDEALDSYERALMIKADYAEAYSNRGLTLQALNRLDEALDSYERALKLKPDYAEACCNRGITLQALKRPHEALDSYERALKIKPDFTEAYSNRGNALRDLKRLDEALDSYERALKIRPDYAFLFGNWLHTKMQVCDWTDVQNNIPLLLKKLSAGEKASPSFPVLALTDSLPLLRSAAQIWVKDRCPASNALPLIAKAPRQGKIRIGYISADYRNHAAAHLMAELFERHDRTKFELVAFSFGPDTNDDMRQRIAAAFDRFLDVRSQSDKEVALLARREKVDIAVDLMGFTTDSRPGIFACRAAPLQINYLGYPGTMGADYMDYLIADRTLIPAAHQRHYAEKIVYLPNSYQANDAKRRISDKVFNREALGLPQTGIVFCCFNNSYKIMPDTFDGWMRILKQVAGSVLWLVDDNPTATTNLRKEAERRGVQGERLVFAPRMPLAEHLARHRAADLFLDTLPYNAHTTASDALWAGLPVLTCMGVSFAGRVAASLLKAIQLPELITTTQEDYESLAVELATHPDRLRQIRHMLETNRLTTPLFDTRLFTRHIEDAYTQMVERHHADLPPEHIVVRS